MTKVHQEKVGSVWVEEGVTLTVPSYGLLWGGTGSHSLRGLDLFLLRESLHQGAKDRLQVAGSSPVGGHFPACSSLT